MSQDCGEVEGLLLPADQQRAGLQCRERALWLAKRLAGATVPLFALWAIVHLHGPKGVHRGQRSLLRSAVGLSKGRSSFDHFWDHDEPVGYTALPTLPPLPSSPFDVDKTVGGLQRWAAYKTAEEAFAHLDKDGDGVLTFAGDHIKRLKNITTGIPKGVFEMYFNSEKQRLVTQQSIDSSTAINAVSRFQALEAWAAFNKKQAPKEPREFKPLSWKEGEKQRLVDELYTFGAPGTAPLYLYDATRAYGCFMGLRTFSRGERYTVGFGVYFTISDPVAWITSALNYDHAKMQALEADQDNDKEIKIHECTAEYDSVVTNPKMDSFFWFSGHMVYEAVLKAHADLLGALGRPAGGAQARELTILSTPAEKVERAAEMSHWAFLNYHADSQLMHLDALDLGFTLVARSCSSREGLWAARCQDHIALFQSQKTLECVFAFEGSDDQLDWVADLDAFVEDFCGFGEVHRGFKFKVMEMVKGIDYRQTVLPKLPFCKKVSVAGHSLGGAQSELFAACANKGVKEGEDGFEDYRYIAWEKKEPVRLPAFFDDQVKGGVFIRNRAESLCVDVRGTMETKYEEDVMVYPCEVPGSNYSKDQQWKFTPEGRLQNQLSGFCVSAGVPLEDGNSTVLRQWPCGPFRGGDDQLFELTAEGFLRSKKTGLCVDSKLGMSSCPYTDQRWQFNVDGRIQNQLSGLCLDTAGHRTEDGTDLDIQACETAGTEQLWDFTAEGIIRNRKTDKCISFRNEQGRENRPYLVIDSCSAATKAGNDTMKWERSPSGFIRNKKTGKCMDVEGEPGTESGAKVRLFRCEDKHNDATGVWVHMPGGFIRNKGSDYYAQQRCLEVFGAYGTMQKMHIGAKLHLTGCEIGTDQRWELDKNGYIRSVLGGRKCLEAHPHSAEGKVWLQNCKQPSDPNLYLDYKWILTTDGLVKSRETLECFTVDEMLPSEAAGMKVGIAKCEKAKANAQTWLIASDGFLQHRQTGLCLDVFGNPGILDHSPLVLWHCERGLGFNPTATDQRWQFVGDGFLRNTLNSKCLRLALGGLDIVPCPTRQRSQQWSLMPTGLIMNQDSGKCIDIARNETRGSVPSWSLVSWTCDPSRLQQQWESVAA